MLQMTQLAGLFKRSLALRLVLVTLGAVALVLGVVIAVISQQVHQTLQNRMQQELEGTVHLTVTLIDSYNQQLEHTAQVLGQSFAASLPAPLQLDSASRVVVAGVDTPALKAGRGVLNGNNEQVDVFTQTTGAVATIFARERDDFVRIATSVKDGNGQRVLATRLDHASPAYAALLRGESYSGKVSLFGRYYMAHYRPIFDAERHVVGVYFVGMDFSQSLQALKSRILQLKIGQTGYVYAVEATPGSEQGKLTIHPAKEGQVILDTKDENGVAFIKDMIARKDGFIRYMWANRERGETLAREKVAAFHTVARWNWVIVAGSYSDEFEREVRPLMLSIVAVGLVGVLLLALLLAALLRQGVKLPLQTIVQCLNTMAQGDYRSAVAVDRSDEIGQVMQSLAAMRAQVWGLVDPIAAGSQQVAAASCQLSAVASEVESSSRQQSEAAGSMAAAMEQLTVSIDQVSDNAREAHRVSNESGVLSADGMQLIQLTAATISRVESDVKTVASTVLDLGQRADAISSIVNTIKEIADQTNLLALNASIEAARAGEQGRGFAVVADEVRKLAERTTASTQEIAGVIQQIQGGTRSVVDQIGSSVQIASEGAQLAARAEDSMLQIKAGSDRVAAAVTDISSALSEQTTASSDIARNVEKIANMAERNEAAVSHVAQAARDLQQLSQHLQQSVSKISL